MFAERATTLVSPGLPSKQRLWHWIRAQGAEERVDVRIGLGGDQLCLGVAESRFKVQSLRDILAARARLADPEIFDMALPQGDIDFLFCD